MARFIFILIFAGYLQSAFGWGVTGHRVIGEIAEQKIKDRVAMRVYKILNGKSLAQVSTWADEIRSEPEKYRHTFQWHYTTWPLDREEPIEQVGSGTMLTAIKDQVKILIDREIADQSQEKQQALKFLVHLIGDLHQPFHVGSNSEDRGANTCRVVYFGKPMNLHQLWDSDIIDFTRLSFTELSRFLLETVTDQQILEMQKGRIIDWARESRDTNITLYPEDRFANAPDTNTTRSYCSPVVQKEMIPQLGYAYNYQYNRVMYKRLREAGVRLALLLNVIFE